MSTEPTLRDRIAQAIDNTDVAATYPEDRAVIVSAVMAVVQPEVDRLRAELADAHMEAARRVAPVEMGALRRQRDEARAEVEQWRATFGESALRDGLARITRAEAERDRLAEQISRVRAKHDPQCGGVCASTPCECEADDLLCGECETPYPCPTIRALDAPPPGETTPQPEPGGQETTDA